MEQPNKLTEGEDKGSEIKPVIRPDEAHVVVSPTGNMQYTSLAVDKGASIFLYLEHLNRLRLAYSWQELEEKGYRCIAVIITPKPDKVTITPLEHEQSK